MILKLLVLRRRETSTSIQAKDSFDGCWAMLWVLENSIPWTLLTEAQTNPINAWCTQTQTQFHLNPDLGFYPFHYRCRCC